MVILAAHECSSRETHSTEGYKMIYPPCKLTGNMAPENRPWATPQKETILNRPFSGANLLSVSFRDSKLSLHYRYLEDHPRTCKWLITMVIVFVP